MIDYLIVGAGLYGATFARVATDNGCRCLVIEKRDRVGGNCADEWRDDILVGLHGGHIFHTNSDKVWSFVNRFGEFWSYHHKVIARNGGLYSSMPFNLRTMYDIYGTDAATPEGARAAIRQWSNGHSTDDLEGWCISQLGAPLYRQMVQGYTEKQWGRACRDLPASIIKRLPLRFSWDDAYYNARYEGMPINGYSALVEAMLDGIEVRLNSDYMVDRSQWDDIASAVVYTGAIDKLHYYDAGPLDYRSLRWEHDALEGDYQGAATVNYVGHQPDWTRIVEWKHFMRQPPADVTIISREYPQTWQDGRERYYPINDGVNQARAIAYKARARHDGYIIGGRLATYQYLDMDQAIASAMTKAERLTHA